MLSGAIARIIEHTSLPLTQIDRLTSRHLRYSHNGAFSSELLGFFYASLELGKRTEAKDVKIKKTALGLACSNTIFPMVMPFASEKIQKLHDQIENWPSLSEAQRRSVEIHWRRVKLKPRLCFCPECFKEQILKYGENYWKLIWQLPLADVCEIHGCPLMETSLPVNRRAELHTPLEINEAEYQSLKTDKHSALLTQTISDLLANRTVTQRAKWRDIFVALAKDAGVTDFKIHIRRNGIFVASKTLAERGKVFWGEQWLSQNFPGMLYKHCFQLGNYWLTYLILAKSLNADISLTDLLQNTSNDKR